MNNSQISTLQQHLQTSEENRNQQWDEVFFKLLSEAQLNILSEDPQQGPDGWPYLICETTETSQTEAGRSDSAQKILHWLSTRGIGLVVNPKRLPYPDYVFSYGMIWSFRETGYFIKFQSLTAPREFVVDANTKIQAGPPSAEYLPAYVREVIRDFLRDQSIFDAKVLLLSTDGTHYDLCFSLESFGLPPQSEHEGILEALSWFVPPHYSLALVSDKGLPPFESL
jgi:hypothetical protein